MSEETAEYDAGSRKMPAAVRAGLITVHGGNLYLKAPYRILWFREEHPDWTIETEIVEGGYAENYCVVKATISNAEGRVVATGHKEEAKGKFPFLSKAETGAIARALAVCGYGTQFGEIDDDGPNNVADSPLPARGANGRRVDQETGEILPAHPLPKSQATPLQQAKRLFRQTIAKFDPSYGAIDDFPGRDMTAWVKAVTESADTLEVVAINESAWRVAAAVLQEFQAAHPAATPEVIRQAMQERYKCPENMNLPDFTGAMWKGVFADEPTTTPTAPAKGELVELFPAKEGAATA